MAEIFPTYWAKPELSAATLHTNISWTRDLIMAYIFHEGTGLTSKDFSFQDRYLMMTQATNHWVDNPGGAPGERRWALRTNQDWTQILGMYRDPGAPTRKIAPPAPGTILASFAVYHHGLSSGVSASPVPSRDGWLLHWNGALTLKMDDVTGRVFYEDSALNTHTLSDSAASGTLRTYILTSPSGNSNCRSLVNGVTTPSNATRWDNTNAALYLGSNATTKLNASDLAINLLYQWDRELSADEISAVLNNPLLPFDGAIAPPSSPTGATTSIVTPTQTGGVLGWSLPDDPNSGLWGFNIYQAPTVAQDFTLIATAPTSATTYTVTGLTPGTWYFFEVRAFGEATESPASYQSVFQTQAVPDAIFTTQVATMREIPFSRLMRPFPDEPPGAPAHLLDWLGGDR